MIDPASSMTSIGEWIRTGGTIGILAALVGLGQLWLRKKKEDREGWGALIIALQDDIKTVRANAQAEAERSDRRDEAATLAYAALRGQHAECERRLNDVESQLKGVHRQFVMLSSNQAVPLGSVSDKVAAAAKRATKIVKDLDLPEPDGK